MENWSDGNTKQINCNDELVMFMLRFSWPNHLKTSKIIIYHLIEWNFLFSFLFWVSKACYSLQNELEIKDSIFCFYLNFLSISLSFYIINCIKSFDLVHNHLIRIKLLFPIIHIYISMSPQLYKVLMDILFLKQIKHQFNTFFI